MMDRMKRGLAVIGMAAALAAPLAWSQTPPPAPASPATPPAAAATPSPATPSPATPPAATPPAPVNIQNATPAIWHITKPNGHTITLFGSVHLLPGGEEFHTPALKDAFDKADVVVFETPIADMATPELTSYVQSQSMNPPGVTLSSLLKPDEKTDVQKAALSIGIPFSMLEPFRPWLAGLQIEVSAALKQGFQPNAGVDKTVEAEAKKAGKQLGYFETGMEQIKLFTELPPDQELAFLVIGCRELNDNPDELKGLIAAWAKGDVAQIDAMMNTGMEKMPELAKKLLEDRNARFTDKIANTFMADDKNYLIIVGAGHLAGAKGVPSMLRAKGIAVEGP